MKKYAQFFRDDYPLLGSDSILQLDARYGVAKCINEIIPHVEKLNRNMNYNINKFEIRSCPNTGNIFTVYRLIYTGVI